MRPDAMQLLPLETAALESWLAAGCGTTGAPVKGVLALLPAAEAARLPLLQQVCREAGVALFGGLFPKLVAGDALLDSGAWLLALPEAPHGFLAGCDDSDVEQAGAALAQAALAAAGAAACVAPAARPTLLLVFDGQLARIGSVVEQAYLQLDGRMRLLGVNAGSESFGPMPCLFDARRCIAGGVLGVLLPEAMRAALGLQPTSGNELYTVTASAANRVASINGRPAFDVYRELVGRDHGVELSADNFYRHAVHYPLMVLRGDNQMLYRIPVRLEDDGAITCIGEIPQYSLLSVVKSPAPGQMQCVPMLGQALQPQPAAGQLVVFYCAGRRQYMGEAYRDELRQLQQELQPAVQAGALTLGEIGNTNSWGYPLFYNGALVALGWDLGA